MSQSVFFGSRPALARAATTAISALMVLSIGVAFNIRGGAGTSTYIDREVQVITCTDTGGLAKYPYCNWQEPQGDAGSGSVITQIMYSIGDSPAVVGVDFTVGKSLTASGTFAVPNMQNVQTGTGKTVMFSTGAILIDSGSYLRAVTLTNPGVSAVSNGPTTSHTASMEIEYYTRLSK